MSARRRRLAGGLVLARILAGEVDGLERSACDLLFRIRGPRQSAALIVVAAIRPDSLEALGDWPVRRALHGPAIERLHEAGAAAIGVDVLFPGPVPPGPRDDDRLLGAAVARVGTSCPPRPSQRCPDHVTSSGPSLTIAAGAAAVASVKIGVDPDGVVSRMTLDFELQGHRPHFVVEIHRLSSSSTSTVA